MKRTAIRRVSKKRARELRIYAVRRLVYLEAHPHCQIWLAKHGVTEEEVIGGEVLTEAGLFDVPLATDIHHTNGRNGWRLLDETHWLSACREEHDWVKQNQSAARAIDVLK